MAIFFVFNYCSQCTEEKNIRIEKNSTFGLGWIYIFDVLKNIWLILESLSIYMYVTQILWQRCNKN